MAITQEKFYHKDDKIVHQKTHDWNAMLKEAEMMREHGGKFGESQCLGVIDMDLLSLALKQRGVKWDDEEARNQVVMEMLRSPDYSKLRVYQGNF